MAYTSDDLVSDIQRDSYLPTAQGNFTSAQLLAIADQELQKTLAPLLRSLQEGYYLEYVDTALTSGTASYAFPEHAMWNAVRRVQLYRTDGSTLPLHNIDVDESESFTRGGTGQPTHYSIEHDTTTLYPTPGTTTDVLRRWIYRRPNRLVLQASAAQVSSVNTGTGVITYTAAKPVSTFTATSIHDVFRGTSPFKRIHTAITATASGSTTTQTFATGSMSDIIAGDWVCIKNETVFPCMPIELQQFLGELVILSLSKTQMDAEAYKVSRGEILEAAKAALVTGDRNVGQPKRIPLPLGLIPGVRSQRGWKWPT